MEANKQKFYVCSLWADEMHLPFITQDGYALVEEFDNVSDAIAHLTMLNDRNEPNIIRCISRCHPKDWKKYMCKSDVFKPDYNGLENADFNRDILYCTVDGHYGVGFKSKDSLNMSSPYCLCYVGTSKYVFFSSIKSWRYADEAINETNKK